MMFDSNFICIDDDFAYSRCKDQCDHCKEYERNREQKNDGSKQNNQARMV